MRYRPFLLLIGVCVAIGMIAPGMAMRYRRAYAMETVATQAALILHLLAARAGALLARDPRAVGQLLRSVREPGLTALWIADARGDPLASEGEAIAAAPRAALALRAMAARLPVAEPVREGRVALAMPIVPDGDAAPIGAVGACLDPALALRAVGAPRRMALLPAGVTGLGIVLLWPLATAARRRRPGAPDVTKTSGALPPDDRRPMPGADAVPATAEWSTIQDIAEALPTSVILFDHSQRIVLLNAAARNSADRGGRSLRSGMHLLDCVGRAAWGESARIVIERLVLEDRRVIHGPGMVVARLARQERTLGFWLHLEEEATDDRIARE
ncbi:MAG: hypothetical protein HY543_03105 [Deltaproteobacteria bacterium]|nr:hypothetical protein [Deltaproteobacteria bacterium]